MSVSFHNPETYDQLEAIGGLYKALFNVAEQFKVDPMKLIRSVQSQTEYEIEQLRKEVDTGKKTDNQVVNDDKPINLDDIPF
jgi:hypothetical protein